MRKHPPMKIGKLIAAYRQVNKLTLEQVAQETGVKPLALWRLEKGKYSAFKQWPAIVVWVFGK